MASFENSSGIFVDGHDRLTVAVRRPAGISQFAVARDSPAIDAFSVPDAAVARTPSATYTSQSMAKEPDGLR